jgi:hypothetical protein
VAEEKPKATAKGSRKKSTKKAVDVKLKEASAEPAAPGAAKAAPPPDLISAGLFEV